MISFFYQVIKELFRTFALVLLAHGYDNGKDTFERTYGHSINKDNIDSKEESGWRKAVLLIVLFFSLVVVSYGLFIERLHLFGTSPVDNLMKRLGAQQSAQLAPSEANSPPPIPEPMLRAVAKPVPLPPPSRSPPVPSRTDQLRRAVAAWRSKGIEADPAGLELLKSLRDTDQGSLGDDDWRSAKNASDVLNASSIGMSAQTAGRLPYFVRASSGDQQDVEVANQIKLALEQAQMMPAPDEDHAAIVIELGKATIGDTQNRPEEAGETWFEDALLPMSVVYNADKRNVVPPISSVGHYSARVSDDRDQSSLRGCALLDAGLNATSTFLSQVGLTASTVRPDC